MAKGGLLRKVGLSSLAVLAVAVFFELSVRAERYICKERDSKNASELVYRNIQSWVKTAEAHEVTAALKGKYQRLLRKDPNNVERQQMLRKANIQFDYFNDMLLIHEKINASGSRVLGICLNDLGWVATLDFLRMGIELGKIRTLGYEMDGKIEKYRVAQSNSFR